eukprot:gene3692-4253_t
MTKFYLSRYLAMLKIMRLHTTSMLQRDFIEYSADQTTQLKPFSLTTLRTTVTSVRKLVDIVDQVSFYAGTSQQLSTNQLFAYLSSQMHHGSRVPQIDRLMSSCILASNENTLSFIIRVMASLVPSGVWRMPNLQTSGLQLPLAPGGGIRISNNQHQILALEHPPILDASTIVSHGVGLLQGVEITPIPLFLCAMKPGSVPMAKMLLSNTTLYSVHMKLPANQRTPLFYAANREMSHTLVQFKSQTNIADSYGMLPIHSHSKNGTLDVVKSLLDDSTINAQDLSQNTPLHWSSLKGHLLVVKALISSGAKLNMPNNQGRYPIHNASMEGHEEILKYFIELYTKASLRGSAKSSGLASIQILDKENNTPIDLAILKNHLYCTFELLKYEGGSGAFADVFLTEWRQKQVAVKQVKYARLIESGKSDNWIKSKFLLEVALMVDLTSQNILLDQSGSAKIADFGISRFKNEIGDKTMTAIGNPRWRAPEVTKNQKYCEKVDVFGFGMILYEPFGGGGGDPSSPSDNDVAMTYSTDGSYEMD